MASDCVRDEGRILTGVIERSVIIDQLTLIGDRDREDRENKREQEGTRENERENEKD